MATKDAPSTDAGANGSSSGPATNFIRQIVEADLAANTHGGQVVTRFPPEPNGFLHIGNAKAVCLNFGIKADYDGVCHLRFDDTNPETEDMLYVNAIQEDVRWLGFDWEDKIFFASDYFEQLYQFAEALIQDGKAYVDSLSEAEIREYRGTVTEPGRNSPYRDRSVEDNLALFRQMRAGDFADGSHVLRAKIDMASNNMLLRDPLLYRIKHAHHYRTGDDWCIYPMYDYAHPLSDAIEGITHSICTLEFEVHRPLYDWLVEHVPVDWDPRPRQYEFARLSIDYTVTSKRKLLQLVQDGDVSGWDDPRMPTLAGLRRRGVTPEAIRKFCDLIGVSKADSRVDLSLLEYAIRDDLNYRAPRVMAVLDPLKVVLTNYPEGQTEHLEAAYWPHDIPKEGARQVPFSRELYIERDDFMEVPTKGFFRLAPGREVRLRHAYIIKCEEVIKDADGQVVELRCTYDADTRSGGPAANRKVKGTLHWVSAPHAVPAEVRLYDRLFRVPNPDDVPEGGSFKDHLNPSSVTVLRYSLVEPSVQEDPPGTRYQFERQGYFISDAEDSSADALAFNRIVTLRDTWAKIKAPTPKAKPKAKPVPKPNPSPREATKPAPAKAKTPAPRSPELAKKMAHYIDTYHLAPDLADQITQEAAVAAFFEDAIRAHHNPVALSKWVVNVLAAERKQDESNALPITGADLGALVSLIDDKTITRRMAKEVFAEMLETGDNPREIVARQGLRQVANADTLAPIVANVLAAYPDKVGQYREGKKGLMGFFVGQVMRETQGQANPKVVKDLLSEQLS